MLPMRLIPRTPLAINSIVYLNIVIWTSSVWFQNQIHNSNLNPWIPTRIKGNFNYVIGALLDPILAIFYLEVQHRAILAKIPRVFSIIKQTFQRNSQHVGRTDLIFERHDFTYQFVKPIYNAHGYHNLRGN